MSNPKKAKELYSNFRALANEIEGAAVTQFCSILQLPYIIVRNCRDNTNTNTRTDYFKFVEVASTNSTEMVLALLEK